jgi:DegV family protein with EDD domain
MNDYQEKVSIITDSISCLTPEIIRQYDISIVPINIHFNGRIYRDGVDLSMGEAYRMLSENPGNFASSPASTGEYFRAYREASLKSRNILVITISAKLSTMINIANLARERAREELPGTSIEILNSNTATIGEGLIVTAAARAAESGQSLAEVTRTARQVSESVRVEGVLNTMRYVYRTGRIPEIPAKLGSLLKIKPVFVLTGGKVQFAGITRDREKGIDLIIRNMRKDVGVAPIHIAVAHAEEPLEGRRLQERLGSEFTCVESWLTDFSPVMAYATGAGVLVAAYYR